MRIRGNQAMSQRTRPMLRLRTVPATQSKVTAPRGRGRIQKQNHRHRGNCRSFREDAPPWKASTGTENACAPPIALPGLEKLKNVLRTKATIHACSEQSLDFVTFANLETNEDTNTIALNLMDYFLFSTENWVPELSYCKLHAACFLMAGLITGMNNTTKEIADSLGPDCTFVQLMATPLSEDDESAAAISSTISVGVADVERGYGLLYERREQLATLMGHYAANVISLPMPTSSSQNNEEQAVAQEENFDTFEE